MMKNVLTRLPFLLACILGLILLAPSSGAEPAPRSDSELKSDRKSTERELKDFQSLQRKLASSGKKSSNADRRRVIDRLQETMVDIIRRREQDLGTEHRIRMHGEMVTASNDDIPQAGDPIVRKNHSTETFLLGKGFNAGRLGRLSKMQRLYIVGERGYLAAIERQSGAFERYTDMVTDFALVLQVDLDALTGEIAKREQDAQDEEDRKKALYEDPKPETESSESR